MLRRRLDSTAPATNLQSTEQNKRARVTTTTSSTVAQAYALTVAQQISQMPSLDAATSSSSSNASNTSIASTSPSTEDWLDERKKILPPEYGLTIDDLNKIRQNAIHEINRFKEIFDELNQTRLYELITHNEPRLKHAIAEWRAATAKFPVAVRDKVNEPLVEAVTACDTACLEFKAQMDSIYQFFSKPKPKPLIFRNGSSHSQIAYSIFPDVYVEDDDSNMVFYAPSPEPPR